jgi:ArsR family transcriptional regulator
MSTQDNSLDLVAIFKSLGDPTRLRIFEFLRSCSGTVAIGETGEVRRVMGPTVGEVCCHVTGSQRINSRISHHLKELRLAGLIKMERRGKNMICCVDPIVLAKLAVYFDALSQDSSRFTSHLETLEDQQTCQTRS